MKKTYKYQLPQNKEVKGTNVRVENGEILVDVEFEEQFEPKDGEQYWFIEDDGSVSLTLNNKYEYIQCRRIGRNNCFKTKEAAQKVADQIEEIFKNSKAE